MLPESPPQGRPIFPTPAQNRRDLNLFWELWQAEKFWACHEALEDVWRREKSPRRRQFLQGLVHLSAAMFQHRRGGGVGAARQMTRAKVRLEPFFPRFENVEIEVMFRAVEHETRDSLAQNGHGLAELEATLRQKIGVLNLAPMIPSLSPVTAGSSLPLEEQIALCARHDFRGLEISISAAQNLGLEKAQSLFAEHDVLPVSFGLPVQWRNDDAEFEADFALLEERAAFAKALGVSRSHTWVLPDNGGPVAEYAELSSERFSKIARVFARHDIQLALEFLGPQMFRKTPGNSWFYTIDGALEVADKINVEVGKTTVGLLIDCWHWHAGGDNLMSLAAVPLEQIVHVHINDAPQGVALPDLVDNVRELPGATGEIDIAGFLSTLRALGYEGPVAVETFSERLKSLSPDEAAREASEAMKKVLA